MLKRTNTLVGMITAFMIVISLFSRIATAETTAPSIDCSDSGPIHYSKVSFGEKRKSEQNMRSCKQYVDVLTENLKQLPADWAHFNAEIAKDFKENKCSCSQWCQLGAENMSHMIAPFRYTRGFNGVRKLHYDIVNGLKEAGWCK